MTTSFRLPTAAYLLVVLGAVWAVPSAGPALAAAATPIASGHMQWAEVERVDAGAEAKSVHYALTGPGQLVVDYVVTPYRRRDFYSSSESCLQTGGTEYWGHVSSETFFGSERAEGNYPPHDGSVADMRVRTIWQIPAQSFEGDFLMQRPVNCGLNSCYGFAATINFNAYFYPEGETPPPASEMPLPGAGDSGIAVSNNLEEGYDRPGSDINCVFPIPNANVCQSMCENNDECVAFTWVRPQAIMREPWNGQPICCLKNAAVPPQANKCCVSGLK